MTTSGQWQIVDIQGNTVVASYSTPLAAHAMLNQMGNRQNLTIVFVPDACCTPPQSSNSGWECHKRTPQNLFDKFWKNPNSEEKKEG